MDQALKQRLVGALVLIALAVIFLPVFISGSGDDDRAGMDRRIIIPPAPDSKIASKRLPVFDDADEVPRATEPRQPQWPIEDLQQSVPANTPATESASESENTMRTGDRQTGLDQALEQAPAGQPGSFTDNPDDPAVAAPGSEAQGSDASAPAPAPAQAQAQASQTVPSIQSGQQTAAPVTGSETDSLLSAAIVETSWRLQVASLGNPDNVRRLQRQLTALDIASSTELISSNGTELYRINAGPFTDQQSAQQASNKISSADARLNPVLLEPVGASAATDSTPTTAATGAATTAMNSGLDRYAVQVGVFSTRERADEVMQRLEDAGFAAYHESIVRADEKLYQVRVGPLLNNQDAINVADKIGRDLAMQAIVVGYK